jgi:small subunit ribosomal protein S1
MDPELSKFPPPSLEEDYWNSLLQEGEHTTSPTQNGAILTHHLYDSEHSYAIETDWQSIADIHRADETVELNVIGYNRGGLLVEWSSIRGFVPASQLVSFPTSASAAERRDILIQHVGCVLHLRVIELNRDKNRLVFSERAAQVNPGERKTILKTLQTGDLAVGIVTNITEFGVFIDLGGIEGLIHISELSWGRVNHPGDILKRGQHVSAYVLNTNPNEGRIALSIKRLHPDPWQTVDKRYEIGQIVEGQVTNVVNFGVFVSLEEGLEGLIHISELAETTIDHPRQIVVEGQRVRVLILNMAPKSRRLGLSLRQVKDR